MVKRIELDAGGVTWALTPEMVEAVLADWENEHPGQVADGCISPKEFADRCMAKIAATARPSGERQ